MNNITRVARKGSLHEQECINDGFVITKDMEHSGLMYSVLKKGRNGQPLTNTRLSKWHRYHENWLHEQKIEYIREYREDYFEDELFRIN